jgi:hypothetical protein
MSFLQGLEKELNKSITENGAVGYKTTGKAILDFNFKIASYRSKSEKEILNDFKDVWFEDKELALKFLFYVRDIREGVGERKLFRTILPEIAYTLDNRVFDWVMEYGRADDLFVFFNTELEKQMIEFVKTKLLEDTNNYQNNKPVSLLAKWMPSINTSSKETRNLAKKFIKAFEIDDKTYRKMLSGLRKYLDVIERKCCANEWGKVDYSKVPSQANLKYKDAFLKHDLERRQSYLSKLEKGETKINASVTFPHDIVNKYGSHNGWYCRTLKYDATLEQMWKALPNYVKENNNTLVIRDGSGSMTCNVGGTNVTALDVSTALAIYFSERASGDFKNKFITFSSRPKFIDLSTRETLKDKLEKCYAEDDCSNTNIEKTFDLVLSVAIKNNLKQEEIPNLLIISDMEFDSCVYCNSNLFETIRSKFRKAGYELPKLAFWNVNSRTGTIPVIKNQLGVALVSGFSPAITKMVLNGETDPYKALVKEITNERYSQITLKL